MKTWFLLSIPWLSLWFVLLAPPLLPAAVLPPEPDEQHLIDEDVNIITGLYTREYSLHNDGIVDFKTARQIIISEYNEYWNSVVETPEFPLFYWHDANQDGHFDQWVDQQGNGCLCDIRPYDINPPQ